MINNKAKIIISLLLGIVTLGGILSYKTMAKGQISRDSVSPDSPTAGVSCYMTGRPKNKEMLQVQDLESAKLQLESLYKENKINKETYDSRMENITAQLKKIQLDIDKEINVEKVQEVKPKNQK